MLIALTKVVWRTLLYQQIDPYPLAYDLENPRYGKQFYDFEELHHLT
jgi:hypothetical protein